MDNLLNAVAANITLEEADIKLKDLDARLKKIETTKADEAKVNVILSPKPTWLVG